MTLGCVLSLKDQSAGLGCKDSPIKTRMLGYMQGLTHKDQGSRKGHRISPLKTRVLGLDTEAHTYSQGTGNGTGAHP